MAGLSPFYCCIVEPRCRLCQFRLEEGDPVLVVRGGSPSPPFPFRIRTAHTLAGDAGPVTYHMCCRKHCMKRNCVAACFHEGCYAFKPSPLSPNFIPATHYDFTPSASDGVRRRRRIRRTLARKLGFGVLAAMPEELCLMVAEHLVRECAITTCQELTSYSHGRDSDVDLSSDVYATYVNVEGIHYVQSLDNEPGLRNDGRVELLFDSKRQGDVQNVHVAYDHLGVRDVFLETPPKDRPPPLSPVTRGVWWRGLGKGSRPLRLTTKSDGLKLRQVIDGTLPSVEGATHGWAIRGPERTLIDLQKCRIAPEVSRPLRMSFFDCNRPGTDGYAAAIEGFHLLKLVAHHPGGDISFYGDLDNAAMPVMWMYMPLNPGETVREISAIRLFSNFVALLLHTSEERAVLFGCYYLDHGPGFRVNHLCTLTDAPTRIYFNEWDPIHGDPWISHLGIDEETTRPGVSIAGPVRDRPLRYPPSLIPSFPPPYSQHTELWHYTTCRLESVQSVTCCADPRARDSPVVGMLLRYRDGRRACVGQFRVDWAARPFPVDDSRALRIGLGTSAARIPYVAEISQRGEGGAGLGGLRWMDLPWQGRLEWWFSQRQCRLDYSDGRNATRAGARPSGKLTPWV